MKKIEYRHGNDGKFDEVSAATALDCTNDPGLTIQSQKDDTDINVILQRFGVGQPFPGSTKQPMYGDFTEIPFDFQDSLNTVNDARDRFNALPVAVRNRFENNPYELIRFVQDAANAEEAYTLGILPRPAKIEPPPEKKATPEAIPKV